MLDGRISEDTVWNVVRDYCARLGKTRFAPHDLRQVVPRLGRRPRADPASARPHVRANTERYLGTRQNLVRAVNDNLTVEPDLGRVTGARDVGDGVNPSMRAKVYIETTVPSYLAARPSRDLLTAAHQQITRDWWEMRRAAFDLFVSELVIEESAAGDPAVAARRRELLTDIPILPMNGGILSLAEALVNQGPVPATAVADALHIALATVYACDYLLTWNCRHIANAQVERAARQLASRLGYELPTICTPEELMGDDYGMAGEIVEEVRAARNAYAARFEYDLPRIAADLKVKEAEHPARMADLRPVQPQPQLDTARKN